MTVLDGSFRSAARKRPGRALLLALGLACCAAERLDAQIWSQYDYEDLSFRGVGVGGARVWPSRIEPANAFNLVVDLGLIGPRVRIAPSARFWSSSLVEREISRLANQIVLVCQRQGAATCPDALDLGEVELSDLELALDAHYLVFSAGRVEPILGAAVALHLLNGQGEFINDTFVEDLLDTVAPGIGAIFGIDLHLASTLRLGGEARFMLASDVRYASVGVGGVWTLPAPRAP